MMELKCCPLMKAEGYQPPCKEQVCAWWDDSLDQCATHSLVFSLDRIAYDLRQIGKEEVKRNELL